MTTYYHYSASGLYTGRTSEGGDDIVPPLATSVAPPAFDENQECMWVGNRWVVRQKFTPPAPPPVKLSIIRNDALFARFTEAEWTDLHLNAADTPQGNPANRRKQAKARSFMDIVRLNPRVNLKSARLIAAVNELETDGVIGPGRAAQILDDGTVEEA